MNEQLCVTYLAVLDELSAELEKLAALTREQSAAVLRDDLIGLNDVMKREQVVGLSIRGKEQKREKLALQLGLEGTRLSALAFSVPPALLPRAQEAAERLRRSYNQYQDAAQAARNTLEINLHEIEKILAAEGIAPGGTGGSAAPEPPRNMKTDFRA